MADEPLSDEEKMIAGRRQWEIDQYEKRLAKITTPQEEIEERARLQGERRGYIRDAFLTRFGGQIGGPSLTSGGRR